MSRFSGKCDFYDELGIVGFEYLKKSEVYIGHDFDTTDGKFEIIPGKRLNIKTMKDIVPYFPYVVSMGYYGQDSGTIYLMEKSWPDIEWERLGKKPLMYDYYKQELEKELLKYN